MAKFQGTIRKIDKRYDSFANKLEPFIEYFCDVDDTGQTFQYLWM